MFRFRKSKPVRLYWWKFEDTKHGNFGDEITRYIIEKRFRKKVEWAAPSECDLVGAGSILQDVYKQLGDNTPCVWGSGFIEPSDLTIPSSACTFLSVRGKSTLSRIAGPRDGITLGDPGILASYILSRRPPTLYKVGIVPHYVDIDHPLITKFASHPDILVIDPTQECTNVVEQIASCQTILSSSLHGLIVADSFAIPNLHLPLSSKVRGGRYKFDDYYSAFERRSFVQLSLDTITDATTSDELVSLIKQLFEAPVDLEDVKGRVEAAFLRFSARRR